MRLGRVFCGFGIRPGPVPGWLRQAGVSIGGRCCNRAGKTCVFPSTGWKRPWRQNHITFRMPDYRKEAAFYVALMGWKLRSDDGKQAVLDIGNWGSAVFQQAPEMKVAKVVNFCFVIEPWNAKTVRAELEKARIKPGCRK